MGDAGIPRNGAARSARLASLPLVFAGRAVAGRARSLAGADRDEVSARTIARNAEQLFAVLGQLKGGAMKLGQALSVYDAMIPAELAEPYREALAKLQTAGPPMPRRDVHRVLDEQLGRGWPRRFADFDETPAAAASIGQVHRAVWHDGRAVAVKVQYPGADVALDADLRQLERFSRLIGLVLPGLDARALIRELRQRMLEEVDYRLEADRQRAFARGFADAPGLRVPSVVASAPKVLVGEWLDGVPLGRLLRTAPDAAEQAARDRHAHTVIETMFSSPARIELLHADPHPGNFLVLGDGRLGMIDFGAVAELPGGIPAELVEIGRAAGAGRAHRAAAPGGLPHRRGARRRRPALDRRARRPAAPRALPLRRGVDGPAGRTGGEPGQPGVPRHRPQPQPPGPPRPRAAGPHGVDEHPGPARLHRRGTGDRRAVGPGLRRSGGLVTVTGDR